MLLKPEKIFANKSIKSTNQINQINNDQEKTSQEKIYTNKKLESSNESLKKL